MDLDNSIITDIASGKTYPLKPIGEVRLCRPCRVLLAVHCCHHEWAANNIFHPLQAGPVVDAGGIFEYARKTGMIKREPAAV